jgi:hypothetical protein
MEPPASGAHHYDYFPEEAPMSRLFRSARLAAVAASILLLSAAAFASDGVDSLVRKSVDAYGGEAALARAAHIRQFGKTSSIMRTGTTGTIQREFTAPDRLRVQITYGRDVETRVFDGKDGWRMGKKVDGAPYDAMVLQAARLALPLNLLRNRKKLVDKGVGEVDGKPVRTLELPLGGGLKLTVDIDPETGRIVRSAGRGGEGMGGQPLEFITGYSDFRKVGALLFAFREANFANGFVTGETILEKVELPAVLPAATFRP